MVDYEGTGMGIEEISHRDPGGPVHRCLTATCAALRDLLRLPSHYEVLLMHGGAHGWGSPSPRWS